MFSFYLRCFTTLNKKYVIKLSKNVEKYKCINIVPMKQNSTEQQQQQQENGMKMSKQK